MATSIPKHHMTSAPELLHLLHTDPTELAEVCASMRAADIADALRTLPPDGQAKVMAALPLDLAVEVFDDPERNEYRCEMIRHLDAATVGPLIDAMSADQQTDLFREFPEAERVRLLSKLYTMSQQSLSLLLQYPSDTAGGIMTTEFVSMPTTWTVDDALRYIAEVGRSKETVYAIHVLGPADQRLVHVVSLQQLITADRHVEVPVIDDGGHVLERASISVTRSCQTGHRSVAKYYNEHCAHSSPMT